MTPDEQLELWVAGKPTCPNDDNECCPDCFGETSISDITLIAPCGTKRTFMRNEPPTADVPCPCGDPNHIMIKIDLSKN